MIDFSVYEIMILFIYALMDMVLLAHFSVVMVGSASMRPAGKENAAEYSVTR